MRSSPPAAFVREYLSRQLKIAKTRPIFIGEFNLNRPPSDLEQFVTAIRALGYAGVWPWSLRNRPNETGTEAIDTDPQFNELKLYSDSVKSLDASPGDWLYSQMTQTLLPQIDGRISRLQLKRSEEDPPQSEFLSHEAGFELNWDRTLKQWLGDEKKLRQALGRPIQ